VRKALCILSVERVVLMYQMMNWEACAADDKENLISIPDDIRDCYNAVQHAVIQICQQQDNLSSSRTSPRALAALSELTFQYATDVLASDLDSFAQHAGRRTTINEQDVKLVVRRNPAIVAKIECIMQRDTGSNTELVDKTNASHTKNGKKTKLIDLQSKNKRMVDEYEKQHLDDSDSSTSTDEEMIFERCFNRESLDSVPSRSLKADPILLSSTLTADKKSRQQSASVASVESHDPFVNTDSESSTTTNLFHASSITKKRNVSESGRFRLHKKAILSVDESSSDDEKDSK
jgi:histone H3/H4